MAFHEQALALTEPDNLKQRADLLQKIAWYAFFYAEYADHEQSFRHATSALELYDRLGDKPNIIATRMHILTLYAEGVSGFDAVARFHEHLDALVALVEGDPDSVQKGLVYQRIAHVYLHRGDPATTLTWARKAADVFTRLDVPMGTSLGTALTYTGRIEEGIAYNEGNLESVLKSGNLLITSILGHELSLSLTLVRDVVRAKACAERVTPEVAKSRSATLEGNVRRPLLMIYTLAGDTAKAEEVLRALLGRERFRGCVFEDAACVGLHHLRQGKLEDARADLERRISLNRDTYQAGAVSACSLMLASVELEMGNLAVAEKLALVSLQNARDGGNVLLELWALPVLAEIYLAIEQPAKAADVVARGFELLAPGKSWYGLPAPIHLASGMLATSLGQWDDADESFERALAINRQFGLPYDEARTHYEWSRMRRARNRAGDREAADDHLASALEIFRAIGAKRAVTKILSGSAKAEQ